ncbi:MAG: hypothetical protein Q4A64_00100 [Porphyromonadaceae bacterium]|nr:hypothetical protein [Porphyromonadaceae bacterium]
MKLISIMSPKSIILLVLSVFVLGVVVSCSETTDVPAEAIVRKLSVTKKEAHSGEKEGILMTPLPNGFVRYVHYGILAPIELRGTPHLEISRVDHKVTLKEVFVGNPDVNGIATHYIEAELGVFDIGHEYQFTLLNHKGKRILDSTFRYGGVLEFWHEFPKHHSYLP